MASASVSGNRFNFFLKNFHLGKILSCFGKCLELVSLPTDLRLFGLLLLIPYDSTFLYLQPPSACYSQFYYLPDTLLTYTYYLLLHSVRSPSQVVLSSGSGVSFVNGQQCSGEVRLQHNDRVILGNSQAFRYVDPVTAANEEGAGKPKQLIDWDLAQHEINEAMGMAVTLKVDEEISKKKAEVIPTPSRSARPKPITSSPTLFSTLTPSRNRNLNLNPNSKPQRRPSLDPNPNPNPNPKP